MFQRSRPPEVARLFNAPFCGEVLRRFSFRYAEEGLKIYPTFPIVFLVLPIVLHKSTRDSFGLRTRTPFLNWIQENPFVRVGFADRARDLKDFTLESIIFLLQQKQASIGENGRIVVQPRAQKALSQHSDGEIYEILKKSEFVGKWFATAGDVGTLFAALGVRP